MENILWTQNELPKQIDTFVIDGEKTDYDYSEKLDKAFKTISNFSKYKKSIVDCYFIKRLGLQISSNLAIADLNKDGYLVQGNYIEKDGYPRKMPYVFWSEDKDIESFLSTLQKYSDIVGKTIPENDIKAIKVYLNHKKSILGLNKKKLIIIVGSLLILLLLWMII